MDNSVGELAVGTWIGMGRGGQRGKNWDNSNRITTKNDQKNMDA